MQLLEAFLKPCWEAPGALPAWTLTFDCVVVDVVLGFSGAPQALACRTSHGQLDMTCGLLACGLFLCLCLWTVAPSQRDPLGALRHLQAAAFLACGFAVVRFSA